MAPSDSPTQIAASTRGKPDGHGEGLNRPVRLRDIAKLAGVHVTAVSAVLSPRSTTQTRVAASTAERIRELATRLNYRPNFAAQLMRKRKSGLIGLIEFGRSEAGSRRGDAVAKALRARGYHILTANVLWYSSTEEAIDQLLSAQVEAIVFVMLTAGAPLQRIYELQKMGIPCIGFNGIHLPGMPQIRSDAEDGIRQVTRHLLTQGHRRLALITSWSTLKRDSDTSWPTLERIHGFQTAIEEAGGKLVERLGTPTGREKKPCGQIVSTDPTPAGTTIDTGHAAARDFLSAGPIPDAIVCGSDQLAFGVLRACYEMDIKVPDDLAVVGLNGEAATRFFCPALTTVDTLNNDDAEVVVNLLEKILKGEEPAQQDLVIRTPCRLIVRESCGSALPPEAATPPNARGPQTALF